MNIPEQQPPLTIAVVTLAYALDALALQFIDDDDTMRPEKASACIVAAADASLDIDSITPIQFVALFIRTQPPLYGLEALTVARGRRSLGQFARFGARLGDECRQYRPKSINTQYIRERMQYAFGAGHADLGVCRLVNVLLPTPLPEYVTGITLVEHELTLVGIEAVAELYDERRLSSFAIYEQMMSLAMLRRLCALNSLTHLTMIDCDLEDEHAAILCTTTLTHIDIRFNDITDVGGQILLDHYRRTATEINVVGNPMSGMISAFLNDDSP